MESEEQILQRHKKEERDLVARATGMKKQANKKTKKRVLKQIRELEEEMERRHKEELKAVRGEDAEEAEEVTPEMLLAQMSLEEKTAEPEKIETEEPKPRRRNRQKERLQRRKEEEQKAQEKARLEAANMPDKREIEIKNIDELCMTARLQVHEVTADGHCLFASIADQLQQRQGVTETIQDLRHKAAEYIRKDPDTFVPFLFDEKTMSLKDVGEYTEELESTTMWGGDLEILALSKVFDCPIRVMMSGRAELKMNEEGEEPELRIVYYQHKFGLGEHYNSLRDIKVETNE